MIPNLLFAINYFKGLDEKPISNFSFISNGVLPSLTINILLVKM